MTTTAAESTQADNESTTVSVRTVPWMKIGAITDKVLTAADAAKAGGLDFKVEKRPLWFGDVEDVATAKPDRRVHERVAIVRTDTSQWLGIMSKSYPLLQFGEAFDFMDTVAPHYVAAGSLKGGRQGFLVVEAPQQMNVLNGDDPHKLYSVLRTSHDGSRAVEVSVMPLRGRCMNQLTLHSFSKGVPHRWSVKHTATMSAKLAEAQKSLVQLGAYAKRFEELAEKLVQIKVTQDQAVDTLKLVLPDRPRRDEQVESITTAWHTAETVGFDWTGWGLVNATSEYFEWGRAGGSPESRFVGALQGQTHNVLNRLTARLLTRSAG